MRLFKLKQFIGIAFLLISGSLVHAQQNLKVEASYGGGANTFTLATGSPGELGLLQALGEEFDKRANAKMIWIKAGSGASMNLLKNKQVLVHYQ